MESEKTGSLKKADKCFCILFLIAALVGMIWGRYAGWLALAAVIVLIIMKFAKNYYAKHDASPKRHIVIYILAFLLLIPAYTLNVNVKLYYPVQKFFYTISYGFPVRFRALPDSIPLGAENYDHGFYPRYNQHLGCAYVSFYTDSDHTLDYEMACMIKELPSCTFEEYQAQYGNLLDEFDAEEAAGSTVYMYHCHDKDCCAHSPNQIVIINKETGFVFMQG